MRGWGVRTDGEWDKNGWLGEEGGGQEVLLYQLNGPRDINNTSVNRSALCFLGWGGGPGGVCADFLLIVRKLHLCLKIYINVCYIYITITNILHA